MAISSFLEIRVVLLASASGIRVELRAIDVVKTGEVKERGFPTIASNTCIEPIFGAELKVSNDIFGFSKLISMLTRWDQILE